MNFSLRYNKIALFLVFVAGAGLLTGCSRKACFAWTAAEGACPSQPDARTFFGDCNDIVSIDSEGTFDDDLCCYEVSKNNDFFACSVPGGPPDPSSGFASSVAAGPMPAPCDFIGVCDPPSGEGCFNCALKNMCAPQLDKCMSLMECISYSECTSNCALGDVTCLHGCEKSFPVGVGIFQELVDCVVCQECPASCFMTDFVVPASCQPQNPTGAGGMSGAGGAGGMSGAGGAGGMSGAGGAP